MPERLRVASRVYGVASELHASGVRGRRLKRETRRRAIRELRAEMGIGVGTILLIVQIVAMIVRAYFSD